MLGLWPVRQYLPIGRDRDGALAVTLIARVLAVPATGAGYYEDLAALHAGYIPLPERFTASPVTPGFRAVREVAEAVSIGLVLDDASIDFLRTGSERAGRGGPVAWGDCVAVSYSGRAGRDPAFRTDEGLAAIQRVVAPVLEGRPLTGFRELAAEVDALTETIEVERPLAPSPRSASLDLAQDGQGEGVSRRALLTAPARLWEAARGEDSTERVAEERRLHTAIRYGVSQALLRAVALARGVTMAEAIADEWALPRPDVPVPIHAQSGHERHYQAEKMMVRRIASLPHGLMENVAEQVGPDGDEMTRYIRWLSGRIGELGGEGYCPTIHLDVYGALGQLHGDQLGRMLGQLYAWELAAKPYPLRIESPVLLESRQAQIETMKTLREYARLRKMTVQLVADEWANTLDDIRAFVDAGAADMIQIKMPDLGSIHNTVEAVLACKAGGVGAFLGGSYAETDLSARVAVHVALATRPDLLMARPGMGVDEAISLTQNEMARTLACIRARQA
jgi:methylaspartate ammonia-lyase